MQSDSYLCNSLEHLLNHDKRINVSFLTSYSNYILGENTLTVSGVQADNEGEYRCAYEVQEGLYLYSDFGELDYLGQGKRYTAMWLICLYVYNYICLCFA